MPARTPVILAVLLALAMSASAAPAGDDGCPCTYALDDGAGTLDVGVTGENAATVAMANAFVADAGCGSIDVVAVAWGVTTAGLPATLAVYDDPNDDGDPSDITAAHRLAFTTGVTSAGGDDSFDEYELEGPADVDGLGIVFVVALTEDTGEDEPLRIDGDAASGSSWFVTDHTDLADPFQTGTVGRLDVAGFAGAFMLRGIGRGSGGCTTDLDGSLVTDVDDLIAVILDWGCQSGCDACGGDTDRDGDTDVDDLVGVVLGWGPCPAENDDCSDAPHVLGGSGTISSSGIVCNAVSTPFTSLAATLDGPSFACGPADADVWFRFVAACDGTVVIDTNGSDFDTVLEVYEDGQCGSATLLACDADSGTDGLDSRLVLERVDAGTALLVRVGGAGLGVLNVCCAALAPDNDACVDAAPIGVGLTAFSTLDATTDGPAHPLCGSFCDGGVTRDDVWYTHVVDFGGAPGDTGLLTVSTCVDVGGSADYDTDLVVYDPSLVAGPVCDDLAALIGCNDDDGDNDCGGAPGFQSLIEVPVVQGQAYLLRVGGWGGLGDDIDVGTGELFVQSEPADEDLCGLARPIAVGETIQVDTCTATADPLAPICGNAPPDGPGRWFVATGTGGELTVTLCNLDDGSFPDTRLMVYCGGPAEPGPRVDCSGLVCVDEEPTDNNPKCPFTETLTWCTAPGVQYLVLVHGAGVPGCGLIDVTLAEGDACVDPPCVAIGACCLVGEGCVDDVVDTVCAAMGGQHLAGSCDEVECPCPVASVAIQQHASDFPIDDVVRCAPGDSQADNWYYRELTAADGLPTPLTVCAVELAIFDAAAAPATDGTPITICLYDVPVASLAFGPDGTTTTPAIGCATALVVDGMAGGFHRFAVSGTTTTGVLVIEVLTPSGVEGPFAGNVLVLGDNGCGESGGSLVRAPFCNVTEPVPLPVAGALLWRVHGEP